MRVINVTIPDGQALSDNVRLGQQRIIGILMPATWASAVISFQGSNDANNDMLDLYDESGNELSVTAAEGQLVTFSEDFSSRFDSVSNVKIRSGLTGATVNQSGGTIVGLVVHDPSQL